MCQNDGKEAIDTIMNTFQKNKISMALGMGLLVVLGFVVIGGVVYINQSKIEHQVINNGIDLEFKNTKVSTIEYGSDVVATDLIKSYKGDLKVPKIDTYQLGETTLVYELKTGNYSKKYYKKIHVVDTKKPKFEYNGKKTFTTVLYGEDPLQKLQLRAYDVVDGDLEVHQKGNYDVQHIGTYKVNYEATDKNGNRSQLKFTVNVIPSEGKTQEEDSVSVGSYLVNYNVLNANTISVRGIRVLVESGVSQEAIEFYVKQFNTCPKYLLQYVDQFMIETDNTLSTQVVENNNDTKNVVGYFMNEDGQRNVYLGDRAKKNTRVVIHECAHAYDDANKISSSKEFMNIYKKEKTLWNKSEAKNEREFFAYTYATYIIEGKTALSEKCPLAAKYFEEYKL